MWQDNKVVPFSREAVVRLIENDVPGVRIDNFATLDEIADFKSALLGNGTRSNTIEQVTRLGISQYEHGIRQSKRNYFDMAAKAFKEYEVISAESFSPIDRIIERFQSVGIDAGIMEEPGFGKYFAGSGKLRNGYSPIHVDFAPQDSADWLVGESMAQLAWNFYLHTPEQNGELLLWDKQWQREDDRYQIEHQYYYHEAVTENAPLLKLPVYAGEVILINSRNFHAVAETKDRLAFGSFISVFSSLRLRLWS